MGLSAVSIAPVGAHGTLLMANRPADVRVMRQALIRRGYLDAVVLNQPFRGQDKHDATLQALGRFGRDQVMMGTFDALSLEPRLLPNTPLTRALLGPRAKTAVPSYDQLLEADAAIDRLLPSALQNAPYERKHVAAIAQVAQQALDNRAPSAIVHLADMIRAKVRAYSHRFITQTQGTETDTATELRALASRANGAEKHALLVALFYSDIHTLNVAQPLDRAKAVLSEIEALGKTARAFDASQPSHGNTLGHTTRAMKEALSLAAAARADVGQACASSGHTSIDKVQASNQKPIDGIAALHRQRLPLYTQVFGALSHAVAKPFVLVQASIVALLSLLSAGLFGDALRPAIRLIDALLALPVDLVGFAFRFAHGLTRPRRELWKWAAVLVEPFTFVGWLGRAFFLRAFADQSRLRPLTHAEKRMLARDYPRALLDNVYIEQVALAKNIDGTYFARRIAIGEATHFDDEQGRSRLAHELIHALQDRVFAGDAEFNAHHSAQAFMGAIFKKSRFGHQETDFEAEAFLLDDSR